MSQRHPLAVRPSLAFLLALMLVLPPALLRGNNLLVLLSMIVLAAAVIGLLTPRFALRGIQVRRLLPRHGRVGESLRIRYRIRRRGPRGIPAFAVGVDEDLQGAPVEIEQPAWVLHIASGDTVHGDLHVIPKKRGRIVLNEARLGTSFPFGLRRSRQAVAGRREIVVHPRTVRLRPALLRSIRGLGLDGPRAGRRRGHGEEWFSMRPARAGDRMRDIAWRISAHRDELIAMERTQPQPPRVRVILDLRRATGDLDEPEFESARALEERAIVLAASVLRAGFEAGDEIGLAVLGLPCAQHDPRRGSLHLDRMMNTLALVDLDAARQTTPPPTGERAGAVVVQADRVRPLPGYGEALHLSARKWAGRLMEAVQ
jgi:uncharacterized protein (DUF58 family)